MKRGPYSTKKRQRLATDETYLHLKKLKTECNDSRTNQKIIRGLLKQLRGSYGTKWVRKNVIPTLTGGTCKSFQENVQQAEDQTQNQEQKEQKEQKKQASTNNPHRDLRPPKPPTDNPKRVRPSEGGDTLLPPKRRLRKDGRNGFMGLIEIKNKVVPNGDTLTKKVLNATSTVAVYTLETFLSAITNTLRNYLHLAFITTIAARFGRNLQGTLQAVYRISSNTATLNDITNLINALEARVRRVAPSSRAAANAAEETEPLLGEANGVELAEINLGEEGVAARTLQPFLRARDFITSLSNRYESVRAFAENGRLSEQGVRDFLIQQGEQAGDRVIVENMSRANTVLETVMSGPTQVIENIRDFMRSPAARVAVDPDSVTQYAREIDFPGMFGEEEWQNILTEMRDSDEAGDEAGDVVNEMEQYITQDDYIADLEPGFVEPTVDETEDMFSRIFAQNEAQMNFNDNNVMDEYSFRMNQNDAMADIDDLLEEVVPEATSEPVDTTMEELTDFVTPNTNVGEGSGGSAMGMEEVAEADVPDINPGAQDVQEGATIDFEEIGVNTATDTTTDAMLDTADALETDARYASFEIEESASLLGTGAEEGVAAANATRSMFAGGATSAARTFLSRGVGFLAQGLSKMLEVAAAAQIGLQIAAGITNAAQLSEYRKNYPQQYIPLPPSQGGVFDALNITFDKEKARGIRNSEWDAETDPDKSRNFTHLKTLDQNKRDAAFEWFLTHPDGQEKAFAGARTSIGDFDIDWFGDVQEERWYLGRQEAQYRFAKYNHAKTTYENVHGQGTYDNVIRFSDIMRHAGYGVSTNELVDMYNAANTDARLLIPDASNITEAEMVRLTDYKTHMMSKALLHYPDLDPANYRASKMDLTETDIALAKTTLKRVAQDEESERAHMDWFRIFQHEPDETPDEAIKNNILRTKWEGIYPFGLEGGRYTTIDSAFDDWMPAHISNLLGFGHDGQTLTYTYIDPGTGTKKTVSPQNGSWPPITLSDGRTMSVTMVTDETQVGLVSITNKKPVYTIQRPPDTPDAPDVPGAPDTPGAPIPVPGRPPIKPNDSEKRSKLYHDMITKKHVLHDYNMHLSNEDYDNDKCRVMFVYASAATDNMHGFRRIVQLNHEVFFYVFNNNLGACDMLVCKEKEYIIVAFGEASKPQDFNGQNTGLNPSVTEAFQGIKDEALRRVFNLYQQMHGLTQVYVTGIGMGGGVATLFAQEMVNTYQVTVQSVITFNTPAWFSTTYRQSLNNFNIYEVRAKKNTAILPIGHEYVTPHKVYYLDESGLEKSNMGDTRVHLGFVAPYYTTRQYFWDLLMNNKTDFDHMGKKYSAMNPMRIHWDLLLDNPVIKTTLTAKDAALSNMYSTNSMQNVYPHVQQNVPFTYSKTSIDSKYLT